jgi:hypothetical protein
VKAKPVLHQWLANRPGDKTKLEEELKHYLTSWPFNRLREILNQEKEGLLRVTNYENPAWAYQQAHVNGRLQEIDRFLSLIGDFKTNE